MKQQRIDPKSATYGSGFSRLRGLQGPEAFMNWFAACNRVRLRVTIAADHAGVLAL
jgi:hypothetical protein